MKRGGNGRGRGGPARGYSWPPFEPGNQLQRTHGAYAAAASFGDEVDERAAVLAPLVPCYLDSDAPAVSLLALTLGRIVRGEQALASAEDDGKTDTAATLRRDLRGWVNTATKLLDALGMTPTARARLGLDVAAARRAMSVVEFYRAQEADLHDDDEGEA